METKRFTIIVTIVEILVLFALGIAVGSVGLGGGTLAADPSSLIAVMVPVALVLGAAAAAVRLRGVEATTEDPLPVGAAVAIALLAILVTFLGIVVLSARLLGGAVGAAAAVAATYLVLRDGLEAATDRPLRAAGAFGLAVAALFTVGLAVGTVQASFGGISATFGSFALVSDAVLGLLGLAVAGAWAVWFTGQKLLAEIRKEPEPGSGPDEEPVEETG